MWIISRVPASPPFVHKPAAAAVGSCCMEPCQNSSDISYSVSCSRSCQSSASSGCRHSLVHQDPVRVTLVPRSPPTAPSLTRLSENRAEYGHVVVSPVAS
ncbi:hypothetical protein XELAEV_18033409mg [Xenopus laevis]|uniref:Uncharacterized protein n=1 Tax=Xenopus laevis TaxID=8355 RepID=A0A974HDZ1_XENLA|nr:hypothetical protein XELAEV_18033409mg [Xenopus laevis]